MAPNPANNMMPGSNPSPPVNSGHHQSHLNHLNPHQLQHHPVAASNIGAIAGPSSSLSSRKRTNNGSSNNSGEDEQQNSNSGLLNGVEKLPRISDPDWSDSEETVVLTPGMHGSALVVTDNNKEGSHEQEVIVLDGGAGTENDGELQNCRERIAQLERENEEIRADRDGLLRDITYGRSENVVAREQLQSEMLDVLEAELGCVICNDVFMEPSVVDCGHIFCFHCISNWMSQPNGRNCPTCRINVTKPLKILGLEGYISRLYSLFSPEVQRDRNQMLVERRVESESREEDRLRRAAELRLQAERELERMIQVVQRLDQNRGDGSGGHAARILVGPRGPGSAPMTLAEAMARSRRRLESANNPQQPQQQQQARSSSSNVSITPPIIVSSVVAAASGSLPRPTVTYQRGSIINLSTHHSHHPQQYHQNDRPGPSNSRAGTSSAGSNPPAAQSVSYDSNASGNNNSPRVPILRSSSLAGIMNRGPAHHHQLNQLNPAWFECRCPHNNNSNHPGSSSSLRSAPYHLCRLHNTDNQPVQGSSSSSAGPSNYPGPCNNRPTMQIVPPPTNYGATIVTATPAVILNPTPIQVAPPQAQQQAAAAAPEPVQRRAERLYEAIFGDGGNDGGNNNPLNLAANNHEHFPLPGPNDHNFQPNNNNNNDDHNYGWHGY